MKMKMLVSLAVLDTSQQFFYRIEELLMVNAIRQLICQQSLKKLGKTTISASDWRKYFQNSFELIQNCTDLKAKYFIKQ